MTNNIRNFVIIAHIDHGKSTLADRFLEITKTIPHDQLGEQFLDRMNLERQHGVTIKMHPVRMIWPGAFKDFNLNKIDIGNNNASSFILNLIDTPGHVDFNYEVSRALVAVEGAVLLVDALKGIQAQTLSNFHLAQNSGLKIIGALNKIDLNVSNLAERQKELAQLLKVPEKEIMLVSAKTGQGVELLLQQIISQVPPPSVALEKPFKALIFDSQYDYYKGVIAYVRVFDGKIKKGDKIKFLATRSEAEVLEVGYFQPALTPVSELHSGEIGWLATGLKELLQARVGDTVINPREVGKSDTVQPLAGYKEPQPMVYASFYLAGGSQEFEIFSQALAKLKLNDWALSYTPENSEILGRGYRLGFLGMFHLKIIQERLEQEYGLDFIITDPTIPYKVWLKGKTSSAEPFIVTNPSQWPQEDLIERIEEPWVDLNIITPFQFVPNILKLIHENRGSNVITDSTPFGIDIKAKMPLDETIKKFYDNLKSVSSGYASMDYLISEYRPVSLVKLEVFLAGDKFESLSKLVITEKAEREARSLALRLKNLLPQQNYPLAIQVKIGSRIVARETIPALKKDVTGYLYGGDRTRKMKLWQKQKKGKKKLLANAKLQIPSSVFIKIFSSQE